MCSRLVVASPTSNALRVSSYYDKYQRRELWAAFAWHAFMEVMGYAGRGKQGR